MRIFFSKLAMGSMIAGGALLVSACGHSTEATNSGDTNMSDLNTMDSSQGMTNDASTMDAMGNVGDNGMMSSNSMASGNDMMATNGANAM